MKLILDTHALIWYVDQDHLLSRTAHAAITDPANDLYLSVATIWEISIKVGQGKLKLSAPYRPWVETAMADLGLTLLPISIEDADVQSRLFPHHSDPFDRLIVSHSLVHSFPVITKDAVFDLYGAARVWN